MNIKNSIRTVLAAMLMVGTLAGPAAAEQPERCVYVGGYNHCIRY